MDKSSVIEEINRSYAEFDTLIGQIPEQKMLESGASGIFSVKDIVYHISWFEREMVTVFRDHALIGSDLWNLPTDERNMAIYEENRNKPLSAILHDAKIIHQQLVAILEELDGESLNDPTRFRDMPLDWMPWQVLAGNTYEHYDHHTQDIKRWLDQAG
jgi:Protein of unknown function (DUF1706)